MLEYRKRRTRQPQRWVGLRPIEGLFAAWSAGSDGARELFRRDGLTVAGSAALALRGAGLGWNIPGTTSGEVAFGSDNSYLLPGPLSLVCVYAITGTPAATARVAGTLNGGTEGYALAPSNTNYRSIVSSGTTSIIVGDSITLNRVVVDVLTIAGASGTRSIAYYQDGVQKGTASANYVPGSTAGFRFRLGKDNLPTTAAPCIHFGGALLTRAMPAAEVSALRSPEDFWQWLFEPRRIWVPVSAGGGPAYTLDLLAGSYTTTGNSATLSASRRLDLNAGSYSLLGNQVTLTLAKTLTLDAGSYSLTGQSAQLTVSRRLDLNAGSYSVTGNSAELTYTSGAPTYTLDLLAGSYSLTGNSVNLFASRNLTLGRGNYTITGRSATLTYSNAAPVLPPVRPWYYIPGPIPTTAESWLVRELQTISQATYGAAPYIQMEPRAVEPDKPREGMLAFADGVNWNPGSGAGVYVRASGAWVKL